MNLHRYAAAAGIALLGSAAFAAPVREPAIDITFPESLGALSLKGRTPFPQASEGAVIAYQSAEVRGAVYVYNAGLPSIPNGVGSPVIHQHFQQTVMALQRASREGPTKGKVTPVKSSTISAFPGCGPQFMWRSDALDLGGAEMISRTYLTGFNNHFVKLRVTHPRNSEKSAEQFVQDVRRLLGRCG